MALKKMIEDFGALIPQQTSGLNEDEISYELNLRKLPANQITSEVVQDLNNVMFSEDIPWEIQYDERYTKADFTQLFNHIVAFINNTERNIAKCTRHEANRAVHYMFRIFRLREKRLTATKGEIDNVINRLFDIVQDILEIVAEEQGVDRGSVRLTRSPDHSRITLEDNLMQSTRNDTESGETSDVNLPTDTNNGVNNNTEGIDISKDEQTFVAPDTPLTDLVKNSKEPMVDDSTKEMDNEAGKSGNTSKTGTVQKQFSPQSTSSNSTNSYQEILNLMKPTLESFDDEAAAQRIQTMVLQALKYQEEMYRRESQANVVNQPNISVVPTSTKQMSNEGNETILRDRRLGLNNKNRSNINQKVPMQPIQHDFQPIQQGLPATKEQLQQMQTRNANTSDHFERRQQYPTRINIANQNHGTSARNFPNVENFSTRNNSEENDMRTLQRNLSEMSGCMRFMMENSMNQSINQSNQSNNSQYPTKKWNSQQANILKAISHFYGNESNLDEALTKYLISVEHFRKNQDITEEELLRNLIITLRGNAQNWYQTKHFSTMTEFKKEIRKRFGGNKSVLEILASLYNKKIKAGHSITDHVEEMLAYVDAYELPLDDEQQCDMIIKTMPKIQAAQFKLARAKTVDDLIELCHLLDADRSPVYPVKQNSNNNYRSYNKNNREVLEMQNTNENSDVDEESQPMNENNPCDYSNSTRVEEIRHSNVKNSQINDSKPTIDALESVAKSLQQALEAVKITCNNMKGIKCYNCGKEGMKSTECDNTACVERRSTKNANKSLSNKNAQQTPNKN